MNIQRILLHPNYSSDVENIKANSHCQNTIGSFMCICDDGFYGNGMNQVCQRVIGYNIVDVKLVLNIFLSVSMMMNVLIELIPVLITRNVQILQVRAYQTRSEI